MAADRHTGADSAPIAGLTWWLYAAIMSVILPILLVRVWWRGRHGEAYRAHWRERLGWYAAQRQNDQGARAQNGGSADRTARPQIWVHAVSLGETRASLPLLHAIRRRWPESRLILTHMTLTGRAAGASFGIAGLQQLYLPYDAAGGMARFLDHVRPELGILIETEVWPGLVRAARARNVPLALVNARLSVRSARGYQRFGSLTRRTFAGLRCTGAQSTEDAARLRAVGADPVTVTGNLKFDAAIESNEAALATHFRAAWGTGRRVLVAASTREGEETILLEMCAALPDDVLLVLVPRHPERFDEVAALLTARDVSFLRRSQLGLAPVDAEPRVDPQVRVDPQLRVVLGDSLGELGAYYRSADLAFIGGSLLPLGGQNLLEACARGVPVVVGPYTFNFQDATRGAVAAGAALQVEPGAAWLAAVTRLLDSATQRSKMGAAGMAFIAQHRGATERTLDLLTALLERGGGLTRTS